MYAIIQAPLLDPLHRMFHQLGQLGEAGSHLQAFTSVGPALDIFSLFLFPELMHADCRKIEEAESYKNQSLSYHLYNYSYFFFFPFQLFPMQLYIFQDQDHSKRQLEMPTFYYSLSVFFYLLRYNIYNKGDNLWHTVL